MRFDGKVAVVTGAASGVGKVVAELFVKEGAKVVGVDLKEGSMTEMKAELGENFAEYYGDISLRETNEGMIDKAVELFGECDILINNAGIYDMVMPLDHVTDAMWDKVIKIDLYGPMYASRYFTALKLKEGKPGSVVSTASVGGAALPVCGGVSYAAAKAALIQMTRHAAYCYRDNGVRFNAIALGGCATGIQATITEPDTDGLRIAKIINSDTRICQPIDAANVILHLASDEAKAVTGSIVNVDSGWSCI
ncbi:MAG: SDR family oxidoreductase [Oscillospiraceae bacterium]|nr:SDR family oxidoreductase [Oscillospiraceae bacterium]